MIPRCARGIRGTERTRQDDSSPSTTAPVSCPPPINKQANAMLARGSSNIQRHDAALRRMRVTVGAWGRRAGNAGLCAPCPPAPGPVPSPPRQGRPWKNRPPKPPTRTGCRSHSDTSFPVCGHDRVVHAANTEHEPIARTCRSPTQPRPCITASPPPRLPSGIPGQHADASSRTKLGPTR